VTWAGQALSFLLILTVACSSTAAPSSERTTVEATDLPASPSPVAVREPSGFLESLACDLPPDELARVWQGYYPGRSGEIQVIPNEPNVIGTWYPHSGPWEHVQRVPMLWYGPGHVPATGRIDRPATMADVAPTMAEFLGFPFEAPDGAPMTEAIYPSGERDEAPRLILTLVWDGAGRNLLAEYPDAWPNLKRLIPEGAWYEEFTVGSSPSMTSPVHTTMGTGAFPRLHGVVDGRLRLGKDLARPEFNWPEVSERPTLADLYDRDNGNRPVVGLVALHTWHLSMMGSGSYLEGGDRDLAILRESTRWGLSPRNSRFYQTRRYPNAVPGLDRAVRRLDVSDGRLDGVWMEEDFGDRPSLLTRTPVFSLWQTKVLREVIRREGFGADAVPDLLFTNYKQIDLVGHRWSMNSPQMEAVLRSSDRALGQLVRILDEEVGRGRWVLALTADHGLTPHRSRTGAVFMVPRVLGEDIRAVFDDQDERKVLETTRPTQMWIDIEELKSNGFTLADVARYISRYTRGQYEDDPGSLSESERRERLFSLAIPGRMLERLPCLPRSGGGAGGGTG
jgi:hypothetical protein